MSHTIAQASSRHGAKFVGAYYLLTILMGAFVLFFHGRMALTADLLASIFYIAITVFFYELSKAVSRQSSERVRNDEPCD